MLAGFPHSGIVGSKLVHQLANAFRRSLRPSSPLIAKAFTMCAYSLDHITLSTLRHDICMYLTSYSFLLYYIFSLLFRFTFVITTNVICLVFPILLKSND
jgi:hypothetical protein